MLTEIDSRLLEKIADLTGKPVGAFNIRKDSGCEARQSTEHIEIVPQPEGKSDATVAWVVCREITGKTQEVVDAT